MTDKCSYEGCRRKATYGSVCESHKDHNLLGGAREGAGRPRKFKVVTQGYTVHLPTSVGTLLKKIGGSRSSAFVKAIMNDGYLKQLRKILGG